MFSEPSKLQQGNEKMKGHCKEQTQREKVNLRTGVKTGFNLGDN